MVPAVTPLGTQEYRLQLATYAMLAEQASRGRAHDRARLVTITKTKTPAVVPQTVGITSADRAYAEWAFSTAQREMREGAILPRRSSMLCSQANCAYANARASQVLNCVNVPGG